MASVEEIGGFYVSSSSPKILQLPVSVLQRPKQNKYFQREHFDIVFYGPASSKSFRQLQRSDGECMPISGRQHMEVQTDIYLEELCDPIEEKDGWCQTDIMLDRPATPLFVPAKIGVDAGTQIWTGDLFDYDEEVKPILEALISQTIDQAQIDIVADYELMYLKEAQKQYEIRRNVELADRFRLEEQERRLLEERERRIKEQEEAVRLEEETAQKIAACVYAQNYLVDLLPKVYQRLESQGYFATQIPEIQHVEENFWPWLMTEVDSEIMTVQLACNLLDSLIADAMLTVTDEAVIRPHLEGGDEGVDEQSEKSADLNELIADDPNEEVPLESLVMESQDEAEMVKSQYEAEMMKSQDVDEVEEQKKSLVKTDSDVESVNVLSAEEPPPNPSPTSRKKK